MRGGQLMAEVGYFVFSLDTEMAWGSFDGDEHRSKRFSRDGSRERRAIIRLLDLMDEFRIAGTWAMVGHLLYEKCEKCELCPILEWKGKYHAFEEVYGTSDPLWYGHDVLEMILARDVSHEVAFHGYTHRFFDELGEADARIEIQEWMRIARRWNIQPRSVIFPQGRIRHLELFREAGFLCYRGGEIRHPILSVPLIGKAVNRLNLVCTMLTPQGYAIKPGECELVNIPSSYWLFRMSRRVEEALDLLDLPVLRLWPAAKAIKQAAEQAHVVHMWAHPHEFRTDKDFQKLRYLFGEVAEQVSRGRMISITMGDLASQAILR
jgi:hypothetical protein